MVFFIFFPNYEVKQNTTNHLRNYSDFDHIIKLTSLRIVNNFIALSVCLHLKNIRITICKLKILQSFQCDNLDQISY